MEIYKRMEAWRTTWAIAAAILCIRTGGFCQQALSPETIHNMQAMGQDFVIVDVRSSSDFQVQHIPGAINVPSSLILKAQLPKNKSLVLYCGNAACMLSHTAAQALAGNGYTGVAVLDGGLASWLSRTYPVITTAPAPPPAPIKRISARELNAELGSKSLVILDVRSQNEFRAGHLPGAINIALESLSGPATGFDKAKQVIVYDKTPQRSRQAVQQLQSAGFNVLELSGGIPVWVAMKFPIKI